MNKSQQTFRDQLLAAEKATPTEKYRQELCNLRERKMSRGQRIAMIAPAIFCVAAAYWMADFALHSAQNWPPLARAGLGIASIVSLAWAVLMGALIKRGVIRRGSNPAGLARVIIMAVLVAAGIVSFVALGMPDRVRATQVLVVEAICLIVAGVLFIQSLLEQAELRTREKLIEVEMQIFECGEKSRVSAEPKK